MRKYFNELTKEELIKVFDSNKGLRDLIFDDMMQNANEWCNEYLRCWNSGIDYCIGYDRGAYFRCTDWEEFLTGLEEAQRIYGFLADDYNKIIDGCRNLINEYNKNQWNPDTDAIDILYEAIEKIINMLAEACYKRFMREYEDCFNRDYVLEIYFEYYATEYFAENFYVDSDYTVYQRICYDKCLA